jgi:aminoglycoside phosphotransferase (APT) family kinase protein
MSQIPPLKDLLRLVADAHNSGQDTWMHDGCLVQRLRHGMNNALYRVQLGNDAYACKLCVLDERQRAQREYRALSEVAHLDVAPQPICLDESCTIVPYPAVVYTWQDGDALGPQLTHAQLEALLDSLQCIHSCQPGESGKGLPTAWFHWFDLSPYLKELHELLEQYGSWLRDSQPAGKALFSRLERVIGICEKRLLSSMLDIQLTKVPLRLCHVDPNLANTVWGSDGHVRWVDWEFSGWGDPALDLAEFRWHQALDDVTPAQKAWMRNHYIPPASDADFTDRLVLWDCLLATRWPLIVLRWLWSAHNGPDRLRLTMPSIDQAVLRERLEKMIERAEGFFGMEASSELPAV